MCSLFHAESDGLISRKARYDDRYGGQQPNEYHFDGLIQCARPFAEEMIQTREQRKREDSERRTRKRPRLTAVQATGAKSNRD